MTDSMIEIKHLIRTADPGKSSARAVVRLIQAVAEWNPESCLDITFGSHRGKRTLVLAQYGVEQPGWDGDVAWAMQDIAELGAKKTARRPVMSRSGRASLRSAPRATCHPARPPS